MLSRTSPIPCHADSSFRFLDACTYSKRIDYHAFVIGRLVSCYHPIDPSTRSIASLLYAPASFRFFVPSIPLPRRCSCFFSRCLHFDFFRFRFFFTREFIFCFPHVFFDSVLCVIHFDCCKHPCDHDSVDSHDSCDCPPYCIIFCYDE